MRTIIRLFLLAICGIFLVSTSYAQQPRRILFQTFTNSCDLCPMGNDFDKEFKATLALAGSKVIHLNHHIVNVCDPMVYAGAQSILEMNRLSNSQFPYPIFCSAVDHTIFNSTGLRISSTIPGGDDEWEARINERSGDLPLVDIGINSKIQLDKIGQTDYWRLIADVKVTLDDNNSDSLRLFYAVTEDGIFYKQCAEFSGGPTNHDNVVRYINTQGIPLNLKNFNAGVSDHVTIIQDISKSKSFDFKLQNMKLIVFVERGTSEDFEIVQAWELRKNFDTLTAPPPSITLSNVTIDGQTYAPDDNMLISYDKTSVDSVRIEYSTNDGDTWQEIVTTNNNKYFWKVPNISTTEGRIRVSELRTGTPSSMSTGNFTVALPSKRILIIKPQGGDTVYIGKSYLFEWSKININMVDLDISINGGATWSILKHGTTGTTFSWFASSPYRTEQALIRLTEVTDSVDKYTTISNQFYIENFSSGKVNPASSIISGLRIRPQPVESGKSLTIELVLAHPDKIEFALFDMSGKRICDETAHEIGGEHNYLFQLPRVAAGAYVLTATDSRGGQVSKLIEVQ